MSLAKGACRRCEATSWPNYPHSYRIGKWIADHHLTKSFAFPDFKTALAFVNRAGAVAEAEGHHPDLLLTWGRVDVKTYTHKIDGLTESDFILAAKIDREFPASDS